jgi:hypothetical protein
MPISMTFKIVSKASGKVLNVLGGSQADGTQIIQFQETDAANELWKVFIPSDRSGFVIQSVGSGKNLDLFHVRTMVSATAASIDISLEDGAFIVQFDPSQELAALSQQWRFINFPLDGDTGLCHIVSLMNGKRLDVDALSFDNGAFIVQFGPPQVPRQLKTQLWKLVLAGISSGNPQGVKSQLTGFVLDASGSLEDGAPIIQSVDRHASGVPPDPSQRWRFEPLAGGFFKIISSASGKVLDVSGGSLDDGAPIIQSRDQGSPSQQWQLVAEPPLDDRLRVFKITNRSSGKVLSIAPGANSQKLVQKSLRSFDVSLGAMQWTLFE